MWFSPLKGAHLTLGQLDKTLPVDTAVEANAKIERGSFVFIKAGTTGTDAPKFQLYTATEAAKANAVPYIALMGVKDFQAGMAGNIGQAPETEGISKATKATGDNLTFLGVTTIEGAQDCVGPRITAISCVQPAEYQTTAYDKTKTTYYIGMPLTINNEGKLTPFETGKNIVGYVTAVPAVRWVNDLGASVDGARISGGNTEVIEFSTAWIPVAATAENATILSKAAPAAAAAAKPAAK